jgi:hypothetical protein
MSEPQISPYEAVLDRVRRNPHPVFLRLSGLIVAVIALTIAVNLLDRQSDPVLPIEFRLLEPDLSNMSVHIDRISSCSCWHGPRDQAQRKYKFRVVNDTSRVINISGGEQSAIRLIVAYPSNREPLLTMPSVSDYHEWRQFESPSDLTIPITERIARVHPSRIRASNDFFGVPQSYSVWALPPAPNKVAEMIAGREGSYPTVVDQTHLLPGEEYQGNRLGHGTWTFYIPIPHRFSRLFAGEFEPILSREEYERHVIFVGVAALAPEAGAVRLLGFAPAPSENALASPKSL